MNIRRPFVGSAVASLCIVALASCALAGPGPQDDPFRRDVDKKKVKVPAVAESVVAPPSLEVRAAECRGAASDSTPVQETPCMYLVQELKLTGVVDGESGPEAFLAAGPTKRTVIVRTGDRLYDGRVVSIRDAGVNGPAEVVLEKVTQKRVGKKVVSSTSDVSLKLAGGVLGG